MVVASLSPPRPATPSRGGRLLVYERCPWQRAAAPARPATAPGPRSQRPLRSALEVRRHWGPRASHRVSSPSAFVSPDPEGASGDGCSFASGPRAIVQRHAIASRNSVTNTPKVSSRARYHSFVRQCASGVRDKSHAETTIFEQKTFCEIRDGIHTRYEATRADANQASAEHAVSQAVEEWEVHEMAQEMSMSVADVGRVKAVFDSYDADGNGVLDAEEFQHVVTRLLQHRGQAVEVERVKLICQSYWWEADASKPNTVNFKQFLKWYSTNGLHDESLLSEDERRSRRLAAQYSVSKEYVDSIWRLFEGYDKDGSGTVDMEEFRHVLHRALKVPPHLDLPASRVRYFWSEIDTDGSGAVVFEEFLAWWVKYFDESSTMSLKHVPFEDFYKQVRRMGRKHLDPPAYGGKRWEASDLDFLDEH